MQNVAEREAGGTPIREIKTLAELTEAGFPGTNKAELIGEGFCGHVYGFNYIEGGKTKPAVLQYFDKDQSGYPTALVALKIVKGIPEAVVLYADVDAFAMGYPVRPALIKEKVVGKDMRENKAIFPARKESGGDKKEQVQKAKWMLAYLEALGKIHKRGVLMSDFKIQDALWKEKEQQIKLLDFGNAVIKGSPSDKGAKSEKHDIGDILDIFFANTSVGQSIKMEIDDTVGVARYPKKKSGISMPWKEFGQAMMVECQRSGAVPELAVLVNRFQGPDTGKVDPIIDEMKNYFHTIGLGVETDNDYVMRRYEKNLARFLEDINKSLDDPASINSILNAALLYSPPEVIGTSDEEIITRVFKEQGKTFVLAHYSKYPGESQEVSVINRYMLIRQRESIVSLHNRLFPEEKIGDPQKPFQSRDERMAVALGIKRTEIALDRLTFYIESARNMGNTEEARRLEQIKVLKEQELLNLKGRPGEIKRREFEEVKDFTSQLEASVVDPDAFLGIWNKQTPGVQSMLKLSHWYSVAQRIVGDYNRQFTAFPWQEQQEVSPGIAARIIRQKPGIAKSEKQVIVAYLERKGIRKDNSGYQEEMYRIFKARLGIYHTLARPEDKDKLDRLIKDFA